MKLKKLNEAGKLDLKEKQGVNSTAAKQDERRKYIFWIIPAISC